MILITGSTGFIGTYLVKNFTKDIITNLNHQNKYQKKWISIKQRSMQRTQYYISYFVRRDN